ncbi:unnamed protein product [Callosobruchus maculatus]|uniref:C2H2-type domain-containing protein n=1 Tax=Callosobruchus maculatus TaxID=64391 RepID=A0A653BHZ9_CALMS|nr:unnamed protein product [Callosobruchus maculatus]VEN39298.1 unnamed protein product [Callosobruchus maculatus]
MEKYTCNRCNSMFTTKWNLKRHQATICNVSEEPPSKRTRVKTTTRVKQPATKGAPIAQPGPTRSKRYAVYWSDRDDNH